MWTCSKCGRIFKKANQPHSCKKIPLKKHFKNKEKSEELFNYLLRQINSKVGRFKIISIPCCVHLFGKYDFLAILPKKNNLELRFAFGRRLRNSRLKNNIPMSKKTFKICLNVNSKKEIDKELIGWLKESYYLKNF